MSLENQVTALAERIGQEFQQQRQAGACPWRMLAEMQGAILVYTLATSLICLVAWNSFWKQERQ